MKRLGGNRDGGNKHRRAFGTFDAALAASGLELDAVRRAHAREVIKAVTELEGRPPDSDGYTVQKLGREVRVVWGTGMIVVHPGYIDCRHRLDGFGPLRADNWHRLLFTNYGGGAGARKPPAATWTCLCGLRQGPGVDVCDVCDAERPG